MNQKARILIVEDEMPLALLMVHLLAQADCESEVATTGKKAMQLAEEGNFDLITLDVDLPDDNGLTLCSRLKENPRLFDTPIVFISEHFHKEDIRRGLELGAVDHIIRPFAAIDFVGRILARVKTEEDLSLLDLPQQNPMT